MPIIVFKSSLSRAAKPPVLGEKNTQVTGQSGTKILSKKDTHVPQGEPWKPHVSKASPHDSQGPLVPVLSKGFSPVSRLLLRDLPAVLQSAYKLRKEACVAFCDRVIAGELLVSDLTNRYPHEFNSFRNMVQRAPDLDHFVCKRWEDGGFVVFLRDKGPIPVRRWTLDRIDPHDPEYSPDKTHWASKRMQTRNRRNTVLIVDAQGVARTPEELAKHSKGRLKADTIRKNKRRGWTDAEIIQGRRTATDPQITFSAPPANPAKSSNDKLADIFEGVIRALYPTEDAPLTRPARGQLSLFGKYLDGTKWRCDKAGVLEFLLRNWADAREDVLDAIGHSKGPARPSPGFLLQHAREFVNFVGKAYKPESLKTLQVTNDDDKPKLPAKPPVIIIKKSLKTPKSELATLDEILAKH